MNLIREFARTKFENSKKKTYEVQISGIRGLSNEKRGAIEGPITQEMKEWTSTNQQVVKIRIALKWKSEEKREKNLI